MPATTSNQPPLFSAEVEISTTDGPVHAVVDGVDLHHGSADMYCGGRMVSVSSGRAFARVTLLVEGEDLARLAAHMQRAVESAPPEERDRLRRKFDFS